MHHIAQASDCCSERRDVEVWKVPSPFVIYSTIGDYSILQDTSPVSDHIWKVVSYPEHSLGDISMLLKHRWFGISDRFPVVLIIQPDDITYWYCQVMWIPLQTNEKDSTCIILGGNKAFAYIQKYWNFQPSWERCTIQSRETVQIHRNVIWMKFKWNQVKHCLILNPTLNMIRYYLLLFFKLFESSQLSRERESYPELLTKHLKFN